MLLKQTSLLLALGLCACETIPTHTPAESHKFAEPDHHALLAGEVFATAQIQARSNSHVSGQAWFAKNKDGVQVVVIAKNLKPGLHGIHIHEKGDCSAPDASSAGEHYNPTHHEHGPSDPHAYHLGDLGNIEVDKNGHGVLNLGIPGDHQNWQDITNRSIIIHEKEDDLVSQPSGNSGARIGCGVIVKK
jgi:Cu-Zn family superoxide dismutase